MCDKYEKPTLVWGDEAFPEHDRTKWRPTTQAVPRMRLTVGHRAPHVCVVKMMNSVSSSVPDHFFSISLSSEGISCFTWPIGQRWHYGAVHTPGGGPWACWMLVPGKNLMFLGKFTILLPKIWNLKKVFPTTELEPIPTPPKSPKSPMNIEANCWKSAQYHLVAPSRNIKFPPKLSQKKESPPLLKLLPFPVSRATSKKSTSEESFSTPEKKPLQKGVSLRFLPCCVPATQVLEIKSAYQLSSSFLFLSSINSNCSLSLFSTRGFLAKRTIETSTRIWRQTRLESSSSTCLPLYLFFPLPSIRPGLG